MRLIFCLFFISLIEISAQDLSSFELLNKSIKYHDPNNHWPVFSGTLHFDQINPTNSTQSRRIVTIDYPGNAFQFTSINRDTLIRSWNGNECQFFLNGDPIVKKEELFMRNLTCERTKMYRDYYAYLYGLPMKLKDPGTLIDQEVKHVEFNGQQCLSFRVRYDESVGKDTWDFFFNPDSYALIGYRFYHDVGKNDGEYITLYGEEVINGIRMPKNRFWYYNSNDQFLGADVLANPSKSSEHKEINGSMEKAEELEFSKIINKKVFNLHITPHWFDADSGLWYVMYQDTQKIFLQVSLPENSVSRLFDHHLMAKALGEKFIDDFDPYKLELNNLERIADDSLKFSYLGKTWIYNSNSNTIDSTPIREPLNPMQSVSPDGKWTVFTRDYNLYLKSNADDTVHPLSSDGNKEFQYGSYYGWFDKMEGENADRPERFNVDWSPDSKYLITRICDTRNADKMYMLDWSQKDAFRPSLWSYYRGSPGDTTMVMYHPLVYDIENKKQLELDLPSTTHINSTSHTWGTDGHQLYIRNTSRGYLEDKVSRINLESGALETMITETSDTGIDYLSIWYALDKGKILYTSEKSGWRHLYNYDINTGQSNQLTKGDYYFNDLVYLDPDNEDIYFIASGKEAGYNPYWQLLYKTNFSGDSIHLITKEKAHHEISVSPDGSYFVDNYSTVTSPTTTVLRELNSGKIIQKLGKAELSRLYHEGWIPPQPFEAIGRDGKTKIYGALWKPTHFDPHKKYPLIDHSYSGPHTQMFPKNFSSTLGRNNQALAELGFIVMMVDGMGTAGRSKAFHDVSYKNMGQNLKDHVLAIKQLGHQYSWIDTTRVGIFGHSAGGYDAAHALLQYPEMYKVGVASSADHDFRMEKAWWPEMYMGWPVDSTYHEVSNITMADRLEGKLLLVHGALDDNVNASATFKLVEALVEADKEFDLLILPSQRHGYRGKHAEYFRKKRWKYFIKHLLKED